MKATAERIDKNTVVMEVEVDAQRFEDAMNQAYKKVVRKVNIPGFRRGKAPRALLENYVGKAYLYNEAVEIAVPEAYIAALEKTGVEPIAQPEVELLELEEGVPLKFKATVKVKPEVELGQYTGIEVAEVPAEVSEEDVDKDLEMLRHKHAQMVDIEDGTVENGDMVTIDFTGRLDGQEFPGGQATDYVLEIGTGSFVPGFEDQVVGMNIGETKVILVTFPENYHNEEMSGKEVEFTVTLKAIKRKELADLDDEFAMDVSQFDTLEELRADMLNNLKKAAERRAQEQMQNEAISKVVENAEVEVPEEMIDRQVEDMVKDMERRLMQQGLNLESYFKYTESNLEKLKEDMRPNAERAEKTTLVLDAIAKKENLEVSDEDVEKRLNELAQQYQQKVDVLRKMVGNKEQLEFLKEGIRREKVIDFLMENASIVKKDTNQENEDTKDTEKE